MALLINPSHLKLEYLEKYSSKNDIFIETGTYRGDTVRLAKEFGFRWIHSIELNQELYDKNREEFKNDKNVEIWQGDSVDIISKLMLPPYKLETDTMTFWLDAHASGPLAGGKYGACPLLRELEAIQNKKLTITPQGMQESFKEIPHTIFIDDCRLMGTAEWGYISKDAIFKKLFELNKNYKFEMLDGHIPNDVLVAHI